MEEKKVAVVVCGGCDIAESLDLDELSEAVEDCPYHVHPSLCSPDGLDFLKKQALEGVNTFVIGACSPRFKPSLFNIEGCLVERANLREMVVWSHEPNDEDTLMLAQDYLRMSLVKAQKTRTTEPFQLPINKTILVVGGGMAGMTAAIEAAQAGYDVKIVEKEPKLGGWLNKFGKVFQSEPPYSDLKQFDLASKLLQIEESDRIAVYTSTKINRINGQPGQFEVELESDGEAEKITVGAIVQSTGWRPYDANKIDRLSYSQSADIVTNVEMEELLAKGKLCRPSDGKPVRRIAFIQCAGSRDEEHLPYCSAVCCRATLKQAIQAREIDPEVQAYVLYKDIRSPGQHEDLYRRAQDDPGIFFTKGEVVSVSPDGSGTIRTDLTDTLLGVRVHFETDLVVLAVGMVPRSADGEAIRRFRDAQKVVDSGETGSKLDEANKVLHELEGIETESILNLNYRQGPDTPVLKHQFPDSHFICFPYETRRSGIYSTGCVRAPLDLESTRTDAAGAALKAIQTVELASAGRALHPRWSDVSYPDFFLQRCTQCKRCTEECPFGVLNEDEKGTPQLNLTRCRRCGICLGACPERVISFKDYSIDIVSSMIKVVEIPDEFDEKPRILAFVCENDTYPALDTAGLRRIRHSPFVRFVPVRCLGSVNIVWIADALSRGFDGILLLGCKSGKDYQCHFIKGSELMGTREHNVREKLKQLALEEDRVKLHEVSIVDHESISQVIDDFVETIDEIGLNPFKGF